jgi:hypothetical protein
LVSFVHCVVCSSSIYGFWLPLWYLLSIVLSVLPRYTDSDYFFGIFKHLLYYRRYNCLFREISRHGKINIKDEQHDKERWKTKEISRHGQINIKDEQHDTERWKTKEISRHGKINIKDEHFLCFSSFCVVLLVFNVYFSVSWYFLCFSSFCVVLLVFNVFFRVVIFPLFFIARKNKH